MRSTYSLTTEVRHKPNYRRHLLNIWHSTTVQLWNSCPDVPTPLPLLLGGWERILSLSNSLPATVLSDNMGTFNKP